MTKNELKAEIKKLQKAYGLRYYSGINSMKKAELESFLNDIKYAHSLKCSTEAETVEVEPKATKKDIIMGLHENGSVECDLETAQSIEKEGFIKIESYKDGLLKGDVCYGKVMDEMFDEYDYAFTEVSCKKCMLSLDDIYTVTKLYDKGYINNLDYDGGNIWHCRVKLTNVLSDFCKRWDIKLSKAA